MTFATINLFVVLWRPVKIFLKTEKFEKIPKNRCFCSESRVLLVPATSKRWRDWRVVEDQFLVNVAGGGFLGEAFSEKVGEGGLFLEGFLAGFGGFQFFWN